MPLSKLEAEIMRAIWQLGERPVRVREVVDRVNARRGETLGYTTVQKVMSILRDKGALELVDSSDRAHLFRSNLSRRDAMRDMLDDLGERVFGGASGPLLTQLIKDADLSEQELGDLRSWIDERLRDGDGS